MSARPYRKPYSRLTSSDIDKPVPGMPVRVY
jgi:hypothetical protein